MTEPVARCRKTGSYAAVRDAEAIAQDLGSIRAYDRSIESRRRAAAILGSLAIVAAIALLVAEQPGLAAGAAVLAVVAWAAFFRFRSIDLVNRRYDLLERLLRLLRVDLPPGEHVTVRLDLTRPKQKAFFTHDATVGRWKVQHYVQPWLELGARLADGTTFQVEAVERFQARSCWATSRSGKKKYKSKTKSTTEIGLRLRPKAHRVARLDELGSDAERAMQLPPFAELKSLTITDGALVAKAKSKVEWGAPPPEEPDAEISGTRLVAMLFLSLYQVLNLSHRIAKEAPAP